MPRLKAIEEGRFRPTYAGANMGHPDRAVIRGAQVCKVKLVTTRPWRSIQTG